MIKMARLNLIKLIGTVEYEGELDPREISADKTDGKNKMEVLNFFVKCFDEEDKRFYTLPVAVWGEKQVEECLRFMKKGDLVYVQGELRYKYIQNKETKEIDRVYTTVKASTIEFISKKLKDEKLQFSMNDVTLIGNLVNDAKIGDESESFVMAVDRLYPSKDLKVPNHKLTDYVHLVIRDSEKLKNELSKGSTVIVNGKLMTRKKTEKYGIPRVVVDVKDIVGR